MRRPLFAALALSLVITAGTARADAPKTPLALVPQGQEFVLHIAEPTRAVDAVYNHDLFPAVRKIQFVEDYYDQTTVRRFFQMVAYFEKELGHDRLELIDKLAGGGVVVTARATEPTSGMLIVKAKDADLLQRFVKLGRTVLEKELARAEGKVQLKQGAHQGVDVYRLDKFYLAVAGEYLIGASDGKTLQKALDLYREGKAPSVLDNPRFKEAAKLKPKGALLWGWTDWEEVKKLTQVKNALDPLGGDPITFLVFGGLADVVRRSPWIAASLSEDNQNFRLKLELPRGREGMPAISDSLFSPDAKNSLPLLLPPRVLSSASFYLDVARFWDNKAKFFDKEALKEVDKGEKFLAGFLGGSTLGDIFKKLGPHHRVVSAQPSALPYKIKPTIPVTAFAVVLDMRDPSFAKAIGKALRAGGLAATFKFGLKMKEEEYAGHKMIVYYFNEATVVQDDLENYRFSFSPCFAQVGNQFLVSSTVELGRDMIDILVKEERRDFHAATTRSAAFAEGHADNIKSGAEQLTTGLILNQGLSIPAARKEINNLVELVRRMGTVEAETHYGRTDFRFDLLWRYKN